MPPIEGNFDRELEILWEGKGVAARGPLEWGPEGKSVTLYVVVMQDGVSATGRTGDDVPHGADEFLVAAAVQGDGTLEEGSAIATGTALINGTGVELYQWSTPVTLKAKAPEPSGLSEALSPTKKERAHA